MWQFLIALKDAPVANLLALLGVVLILAAAGGHAPRFGRLDSFGRGLCSVIGLALVASSAFIGIRLAPGPTQGELIEGPPLRETARLSDEVDVRLVTPTPAPGPTAIISVETRRGELAYGEWGCEEQKIIEASLSLGAGEELRSARVEIAEIDKAKSYRVFEPTYDPNRREVVGEVEFSGLDRVLFNCAGGGHARVRVVASVAVAR